MVCPNCGEIIPEGARSCPVCGYAVSDNKKKEKKAAGTKRRHSVSTAAIIGIVIVVIVIALFKAGLIPFGNSPKSAVSGYLDAMKAGDLKKLY